MEQLLVNLIQNSLDACDAGDRITVEATLGPGSLIVVISDSGCGMTPDVLSRIFDPFFTTNVGKGTGLGLSVCHGIVRSVGGSIEVESVAGQGTRVTVLLPVNCPTKVMDSTDARAVSQQALQVSIDNQ
jgi:signal transduction histidine kinase